MADQHEQTTEGLAAPEADGAGDVRPPVTAVPPESGDGDVAISSHKPVDRSEQARDAPSEACECSGAPSARALCPWGFTHIGG